MGTTSTVGGAGKAASNASWEQLEEFNRRYPEVQLADWGGGKCYRHICRAPVYTAQISC
jgi:hypothetical protein